MHKPLQKLQNHDEKDCAKDVVWAAVPLDGRLINTECTDESTHVLEDRLPLLPGADGVRASHDHTLRVDAQILAVAGLEGQPGTVGTTTEPAGYVDSAGIMGEQMDKGWCLSADLESDSLMAVNCSGGSGPSSSER